MYAFSKKIILQIKEYQKNVINFPKLYKFTRINYIMTVLDNELRNTSQGKHRRVSPFF